MLYIIRVYCIGLDLFWGLPFFLAVAAVAMLPDDDTTN